MKIEQVYELVNDVTTEVTGQAALLNEDLSNVVDVGVAIQNIDGWQNKFVNGLIDRIGKVKFVNRPYSSAVPSIMKESWEYGSIMMKIASDLPEAVVNETWELTNGQSYDPNVYKANTADAKFYDHIVTFEIDKSILDRQLKSAFTSAEQLNAFTSMIFNEVDKSLTIKNDALAARVLNSFIADTFYNLDSTGAYTGKTGMRCVNLLYQYNQQYGTTLTAANALVTPEFLRFAAYRMGLYVKRLSRMSQLFNIGGKKRFTPSEYLHTIFLDEFAQSAGVFLHDAANQFNTESLKFPKAETVPYWQGSGTDYAFANTSKINVTSGSGHTVVADGILGIMFDRDACAICNENSRVTTNWNPKAEFTNYFYKRDARFYTDLNENFVVFYVA